MSETSQVIFEPITSHKPGIIEQLLTESFDGMAANEAERQKCRRKWRQVARRVFLPYLIMWRGGGFADIINRCSDAAAYSGANWIRPDELRCRWRAEVPRRPRKTPWANFTC